MKQRTIVIGDIHGALKALVQLLERVGLQRDDRLIFLGDYVDGWSQSAAVIDYLLELEQRYSCFFIKGNHDAWCADWLNGLEANPSWLVHGGQMTVNSYATFSDAEKREHLHFFKRLQNYYVDEERRLFIHAGFSSMLGPEEEHYTSSASWDRSLWEMALRMDGPVRKNSALLPQRLHLYPEIFIGHTPTIYYGTDVPMHGCNVWNIDTGAAFTGKLSAMDVATHTYWQSDRVQALYPQEKGRNK